ncbi:MAG TPA: TraR/DksA family transcriptional regulator [Blastocatellia bacterium]|nr:TraR/DksA family transcriptional regulator [Blastocatellia bacterium]
MSTTQFKKNRAADAAHLSDQSENKRRLLDERRDLVAALDGSAMSEEIELSQVSDLASVDELRDVEYGRQDALSERLRQIDFALARIDEGLYRTCAKCGAAIDDKRLANDPAVSLCIDCQARVEGVAPSPSL